MAAGAAIGLSAQDLQQNARTMFEADFVSQPDFTIFYPDDELRNRRGDLPEDWWLRYCCIQARKDYASAIPPTSFEFQETVRSESARLQVSRANNGRGWSVTGRWKPDSSAVSYVAPTSTARETWLEQSKWKPSVDYEFKSGTFVSSLHDVATILYELIIPKPLETADKNPEEPAPPLHGLVLLTGSTNSAKSEIARGLVWRHFERLKDDRRRLHLVTYEDPIEKDFAPEHYFASLGPRHSSPVFDVTQRGAPGDCKNLREALRAALRQTPDAFYIGEVRNDSDLFRALDFGGTGHLVFATAHAGSLVEALTKLLRAARWEALGSRAIHIPKIAAVVHLRKFPLSSAKPNMAKEFAALVPSLYRRTSSGMQDLISDGLASILPHFPDDRDGGRFGSLGRQFVATRLIEKSELLKNQAKWTAAEPEVAQSELLLRVLEEDLNA